MRSNPWPSLSLHAFDYQKAGQVTCENARMALIKPRNRPHYPAQERLAILLLRSARGWSLEQTARNFSVTKATIAYWNRRLRVEGAEKFIHGPEPINKFSDFVRYSVQHLKTLCSSLGKVKIAQVLCRAGLHLATSTVGRILKEKPAHPPNNESVFLLRNAQHPRPNAW